jgi:hypothetical protein
MMSNSGPGEYIPPRRIEEGNPVLFYDLAISEDKERGVVASVDNETGNHLASIRIYSDERVEADVPFANGDFQPDRGYVFEDQPSYGGEIGG